MKKTIALLLVVSLLSLSMPLAFAQGENLNPTPDIYAMRIKNKLVAKVDPYISLVNNQFEITSPDDLKTILTADEYILVESAVQRSNSILNSQNSTVDVATNRAVAMSGGTYTKHVYWSGVRHIFTSNSLAISWANELATISGITGLAITLIGIPSPISAVAAFLLANQGMMAGSVISTANDGYGYGVILDVDHVGLFYSVQNYSNGSGGGGGGGGGGSWSIQPLPY